MYIKRKKDRRRGVCTQLVISKRRRQTVTILAKARRERKRWWWMDGNAMHGNKKKSHQQPSQRKKSAKKKKLGDSFIFQHFCFVATGPAQVCTFACAIQCSPFVSSFPVASSDINIKYKRNFILYIYIFSIPSKLGCVRAYKQEWPSFFSVLKKRFFPAVFFVVVLVISSLPAAASNTRKEQASSSFRFMSVDRIWLLILSLFFPELILSSPPCFHLMGRQ